MCNYDATGVKKSNTKCVLLRLHHQDVGVGEREERAEQNSTNPQLVRVRRRNKKGRIRQMRERERESTRQEKKERKKKRIATTILNPRAFSMTEREGVVGYPSYSHTNNMNGGFREEAETKEMITRVACVCVYVFKCTVGGSPHAKKRDD